MEKLRRLRGTNDPRTLYSFTKAFQAGRRSGSAKHRVVMNSRSGLPDIVCCCKSSRARISIARQLTGDATKLRAPISKRR